jgi:molybdopterin molybdotransferase
VQHRTHVEHSFDAARAVAAAWTPLAPVEVGLADALGATLCDDLLAVSPLPSFRTAVMDGWAVSGSGPWTLEPGRVLAGDTPVPLPEGAAIEIATGAMTPDGTTAVLRSESGTVEGDKLHGELARGPHLIELGSECQPGDLLWPAGSTVTPPVLGLAAGAGHDSLLVRPVPTVSVLVLGDELLFSGLPGQGRVRDSLGPQLPGWVAAVGGRVIGLQRVTDDLEATTRALDVAGDVVISTGGTAAGPVDHVHAALRAAGAEVLVDGVEVRPGHPMVLARLADGRPFVGLPGNPLSACVSVLTLLGPVLAALSGREPVELDEVPVAEDLAGRDPDSRLVPVTIGADGAEPVPHVGSTMLRGLALADAIVVVPPAGARAGDPVRVVPLPWAFA